MGTSSSSTSSDKTKGNRGFTLIELLIVISVMAVLSTILVGYSRQSTEQLLITSTQAKLLSLFSRAKFLSIETFFRQQGGVGGGYIVCAYGIEVDQNAGEIFIFQDRVPDTSSCPANNIYDSGNDSRLTGELDSVVIDAARLQFGPATNLNEVVFIPPDPQTVINNGPAGSASVQIESVNGIGSLTVSVNDAGQVKAE